VYGGKNRGLIFGIDFDDTITKAPALFEELINLLKRHGCEVYIVTARERGAYCEALRKFEPLVDGVIFCSNKAKQDVAEIDIWIDDFPLAITHDFKETCWSAGEGILKRMEAKA